MTRVNGVWKAARTILFRLRVGICIYLQMVSRGVVSVRFMVINVGSNAGYECMRVLAGKYGSCDR